MKPFDPLLAYACNCDDCRKSRRRVAHIAGIAVASACIGAALGAYFTANWIFAHLP